MVDVPIVDRDYKPDYGVDSDIYIYIYSNILIMVWYRDNSEIHNHRIIR